MDWLQIERDWSKYVVSAKERWGKLSAEQLAATRGRYPVLSARVSLGPYQHRDMRVRQLGQDAVEQRLADEAGDPRDQHAGSRQAVLEPH